MRILIERNNLVCYDLNNHRARVHYLELKNFKGIQLFIKCVNYFGRTPLPNATPVTKVQVKMQNFNFMYLKYSLNISSFQYIFNTLLLLQILRYLVGMTWGMHTKNPS